MTTLPTSPCPNPPAARCPVVELRQYTLHAGRRDALIALFDRAFVEPPEAAGMRVLGQFRDLDDATRFVWLRGFADMAARSRSLAAFYDGPVWRAHRDEANATMIDSDDVLLLRPVLDAPLPVEAWPRAARSVGAPPPGDGAVLALVLALAPDAPPHRIDAAIAPLMRSLAATLPATGGKLAACYVTETSANGYPRLPVREGESVFVWLARFDTRQACQRLAAALGSSTAQGAIALARAAALALVATPQVLRLAPTARSRF